MTSLPRLSLVPDEILRRRDSRRRLRGWTLACMVMALGGAWTWSLSAQIREEIKAAERTLANLRGRLRAEEAAAARLRTEIMQLRSEWSRVGPLLTAAQQARTAEILIQAIPDDVVLTRVECDSAVAPSAATANRSELIRAKAADNFAARIVIEGVATGHAGVARFAQALEREQAFTSVRLVRSAEQVDAGGSHVLFTLECLRARDT